ncbi:MAG TPA: tetratricopeptide repeat protein, partial [Candidatus Obscuribacter sp.]|nr:tetratricopeptide repeat protein [Candidatus Obscuribacter sp.]
IADCTRSLQLNSNRTHPYFSRGIAYRKLGKHQLALKDFDEAIRMHPQYGEAFYERSQVYRAMGDLSRAQSDMEMAFKYGYAAPEAM